MAEGTAASRTIVITGAASGLGAALRTMVEAEGDRVIGVDRADTEVVADLSTAEGRASAIAQILELSGGVVDGLVTCAGMSGVSPLLPLVNYFGTADLVTGLHDALAASAAPRVVAIGSISSTQPVYQPLVDALLVGDEAEAKAQIAAVLDGAARPETLYPSSKLAITQWARRTAVEAGWADAGIAINVVAPGVILTPMTVELFKDEKMKAIMDRAVPMPLHGYAEAADIARVVTFFLAASTTHTTAQVTFVDGGATAITRGPSAF
ncbi:SDR family NAD(P)-dependent oxidoreductase [Nocardioides sp.]|uniref:SDR family NAD(P)-dependent oxidoreductase n=1 Tax=Nocardioides sp. TaxID=35761 RepID=UPI002613C9F3|nr:SDR family NAD(P)-dependent oxidoreductase [Nocardioides sp.]